MLRNRKYKKYNLDFPQKVKEKIPILTFFPLSTNIYSTLSPRKIIFNKFLKIQHLAVEQEIGLFSLVNSVFNLFNLPYC